MSIWSCPKSLYTIQACVWFLQESVCIIRASTVWFIRTSLTGTVIDDLSIDRRHGRNTSAISTVSIFYVRHRCERHPHLDGDVYAHAVKSWLQNWSNCLVCLREEYNHAQNRANNILRRLIELTLCQQELQGLLHGRIWPSLACQESLFPLIIEELAMSAITHGSNSARFTEMAACRGQTLAPFTIKEDNDQISAPSRAHTQCLTNLLIGLTAHHQLVGILLRGFVSLDVGVTYEAKLCLRWFLQACKSFAVLQAYTPFLVKPDFLVRIKPHLQIGLKH
ncbi:hypothetical protein PCANC_19697 [Puccinia coronata f. sp. avenae]|uniref:Uncharacterized protein n=1 Tax=Puccinia coronata f. sp. avenae TaxID=200324 RepID=A0A2N5SAZ4_9BASI|nr:hypothetical protein PCANC_19697 [Puccinia coronata f. sp. avenae]